MPQPPPPHPTECPGGQVYGDCANACPRTCAHLRPATRCLPETCQPGCACPLGQVRLGPEPSPHPPGTPLPPRVPDWSGSGERGWGGTLVTAGCPPGAAGWCLCPPRAVPLLAAPHLARGPQPLAAGGARARQPHPAPLQQLVGATVPGIAPGRVTPCRWPSWWAGRALIPPTSVPSICIRGAFNCSQEDCNGERPPSPSLRHTMGPVLQLPCLVSPHAVDCLWSPWSPWSPCSVTCGTGERLSRRHPLRQRLYEGAECLGPPMRRTPCSLPDCRESPPQSLDPGRWRGRGQNWVPAPG